MKLRIRGDSIRLRLTRHEVEELSWAGRVEQTLHFGPLPRQALVYAVQFGAAEVLSGEFRPGDGGASRLVITIPEPAGRAWCGGGAVGLSSEQPLGPAGGTLRLLIEKDFACLDRRPGAEDADAYPNPTAGRAAGRPRAG